MGLLVLEQDSHHSKWAPLVQLWQWRDRPKCGSGRGFETERTHGWPDQLHAHATL